MTLAITHAFVSAKGDGADATLVRPSNWNAGHATSMANNQILGNTSGGAGPIRGDTGYGVCTGGAFRYGRSLFFGSARVLVGSVQEIANISINPTALTGWIAYQGNAPPLVMRLRRRRCARMRIVQTCFR